MSCCFALTLASADHHGDVVTWQHAAEASTLSLAVAYCLCCRRTDLLESLFSLLINARPPLITVKRRRGGGRHSFAGFRYSMWCGVVSCTNYL